MKPFFALLLKDIKVFLNDKLGVALTLGVPMILILIFGFIFGGSGNSGPSGVRLVIVDEANSEVSQKLMHILEEESTFRVVKERTVNDTRIPIDRAYARELLETNASSFRFALIFPPDLLADGFGLNLELLYNPQNNIENQMVQGILQKNLFTEAFPLLMSSDAYGVSQETIDGFRSNLAEIIAQSFGGDPDVIKKDLSKGIFFGNSTGTNEVAASSGSAEDNSKKDPFAGLFNLKKEQIYGKGKNPAAQSVGGWSVMFLLFSLTGAAASLFEERDNGLFQRLLAGPATKSQILWSKFAFCSLLGLTQMAVLIAFGELVFNIISSPAQLLPLLVISAATSAAATSFGMLLASLCKTPAQANGMGSFFILMMSALGGAMFPIFMIPEFIRTNISPLTIVYWAMDGILAVLWRDEGFSGIAMQVAILFAISVTVLSFALWRFNRSNLFR